MKRFLVATSLVLPVAFVAGATGLHCGSNSSTYVAPESGSPTPNPGSSGGGSSSSGSSSGASGSSGGASDDGGGSGSGGSTDDGGGGGSSEGGAEGGGSVSVTDILGIKNSYGESVMDSVMLFGCYSNAAQDCITNAPGTTCPASQGTAVPLEQQGLITHEYFQIGGTVGTMYTMKLQANGILEAKYYENGTRFVGNADPANPDVPNGTDTFYTGGDPVNIENYNVYKITVYNPPDPGSDAGYGSEVQHYYVNSFPKTATPYENHQTFPIAWVHDIPIPGGGVIEYLTEDRNCHAVDNCGIGARSTSCAVSAGRNVPNEPNFMVPMTYMGQMVSSLNTRNGANQPYHAQIVHLTVLSVTPM